MKKTLYLYLLMFVLHYTIAQINIIPNGDFENYILCPDAASGLNYCSNWYAGDNTPDYFNTCATNNNYKIPFNGWGYQTTYSGNAYIGSWMYYTFAPDSREYVCTQFISPMVIGQKYYIKYKISLANISNCKIDSIHLFFSTNKYQIPSPKPTTTLTPQISNYIKNVDTLNWLSITDSLVADSNYQYLAINNFLPDNLTDTTILGPPQFFGYAAYYYIDQFCISTSKTTCNITTSMIEYSNTQDIYFYPNPASNIIYISEEFNSYSLFNDKGFLISNGLIINGSIDLKEIQEGLYFLEFKNSFRVKRNKLIIQKK